MSEAQEYFKMGIFETPNCNTLYASPNSELAGTKVDKIIVVNRQLQYKDWYDEVLALRLHPGMHYPKIIYMWM